MSSSWTTAPQAAPTAKNQAGRAVREVVETLLLAALIFFLVRLVVLNFRVDGESMLPNLDDGEMLLVNRNAYQYVDVGGNRYYPFDPPERGDVIVFDPPTGSDKPYIKRIIGLPGEEVTFGDGHVFINGELLPEDYITGSHRVRSPGPIIAMWSFRRATCMSLAITAATHQIRAYSVRSRWGTSWARPGSRIGPWTTSGLFPTSRTRTTRSRRQPRHRLLHSVVRAASCRAQQRRKTTQVTRHWPGRESRVVNFIRVQLSGRDESPWRRPSFPGPILAAGGLCMIETVVESIRVSLVTQHRVVILKEVNGERHLPIWIGSYEAEAIAMELQGVTASRPLPYDLIRTIIDDMGGTVDRIAVTDLSDDVFYARIVLQQNGREVEIDSRPSDAIALAVRARVPIMVDDSVMDKAGVMLSSDEEEDTDAEGGTSQPELERAEGVDEERLSVFRDFIDSLDLDDFDRKSGN